MALPNSPVTLTVEQIDQLNRRLSTMRHAIRNQLTKIVGAGEILRIKPELAEQQFAVTAESSNIITEELTRFSLEFEQALGIAR